MSESKAATKIQNPLPGSFSCSYMEYSLEHDGVYILDDKYCKMIFVPRNVIIRMVGLLPAEPPSAGLTLDASAIAGEPINLALRRLGKIVWEGKKTKRKRKPSTRTGPDPFWRKVWDIDEHIEDGE